MHNEAHNRLSPAVAFFAPRIARAFGLGRYGSIRAELARVCRAYGFTVPRGGIMSQTADYYAARVVALAAINGGE